jgi:crotonobetainyl-CoA:carnitine CoA-transferase CaiB-like acyl-CoA transferase
MLADYGADVVLVEPPGGSVTRTLRPRREDGSSLAFEHSNLSKSSVVIDLATDAGQTSLVSLAATADVVLVPAGAGRTALRRANTHLVICTVSPFGEDGPNADWTGSEMIYQAMSGMMTHNGRSDREPLYGVGDRASYCTGLAAYISVLTALMVRERTGIAQDVAVDLAHVAASMTYPFALQYSYNGSLEERDKRGTPLIEARCADGWISIFIRVGQFPTICEVLGAPELATDPRFADDTDRRDNFQALIGEIQARIATRPADEVVDGLAARRVVAARCFRPSQLGPDAPHLKARDYWQVLPSPEGPRLALGPQFRMSRTPRRPPRAAPALGTTVRGEIA